MNKEKTLNDKVLGGVTGRTGDEDIAEAARFCAAFVSVNCDSCAKRADCHYTLKDMAGIQAMYHKFKNSPKCPYKE